MKQKIHFKIWSISYNVKRTMINLRQFIEKLYFWWQLYVVHLLINATYDQLPVNHRCSSTAVFNTEKALCVAFPIAPLAHSKGK
jgi:hypothetical protein